MGKPKDISNDDDPYSAISEEHVEKLESPTKESARSRKMKILWKKYYELKAHAINGFIMGSMVGGSFGFLIGCYTAFTQKQLIIIPISTVISGLSFGFFLGCGSMLRADEISDEKNFSSQEQKFSNGVNEWKSIYPYWHYNYGLKMINLKSL